MSKKVCYFNCEPDGPLYTFPPMTYTSYERFLKWKSILKKEDKEKDDFYISQNYKLCGNHFEKYYMFGNNRLTRHAVPTIVHGISIKQEALLTSFIEKNSQLILGYSLDGELVEELIDKWKLVGPELNAVGPQKSYSDWAVYLYDVMSKLKRKKVIWIKQEQDESCTSDLNTELVKNKEDFTNLELKILQIWYKDMIENESSSQLEINIKDENGEEYMIEVEHSNDGRESDDGRDSDNSIDCTNGAEQSGKEIVMFTLNVEEGIERPLLQAADIAPYQAPQNSNTQCNCGIYNGEVRDEFDAFGLEIAHQLRSMPAKFASETQQLLKLVLSKQISTSKEVKILNFINSSFLKH